MPTTTFFPEYACCSDVPAYTGNTLRFIAMESVSTVLPMPASIRSTRLSSDNALKLFTGMSAM